MHRKNEKHAALSRLMLTGILLLLCISLTVGITWARYYGEETSSLGYTPREPSVLSLWSGYNPDGEDAVLTGWQELAWTFYKGNGMLSFYVSNGTSMMDYPDEDFSVSVRLLSSLNITGAQVSLSAGDDGFTWTATPVKIEEGTPLFDAFGGGNVYVFLDEDGSELSWDLEGGNLSVLPVQLDVSNLEQEDAALLQLQVVGK